MTTAAQRQRSGTADRNLDLAEMLIQTHGCSALPYQDISDGPGITKAGIHYHFASKTDLGIAVVDRYVARFEAALVAIAKDQSQPSMAMLDFYLEPFIGYARTPDPVCCCGGEILVLPPPELSNAGSPAAGSPFPLPQARRRGWSSQRYKARCW